MTQNAQHESPDLAGVRREAATRERNEILLVIEEYARRLAHGHGATGAQILQQVADAIARRGEAWPARRDTRPIPHESGSESMVTGSSHAGAVRALALVVALALPSGGCFGYRLMRPDEIDVPNYEPREVLIPERCDTLITRAATRGVEQMEAGEAGMVSFCQTQQLVRAQEEEAVARKLEAHAETASFALRLTTVVVGATIAILAWVF